jgi:hypothetical protein
MTISTETVIGKGTRAVRYSTVASEDVPDWLREPLVLAQTI